MPYSETSLASHSTNWVGVPTGLLASHVFNEYPLKLHISGTREYNRSLFVMLEQAKTAQEADEVFANYMNAAFAVDQPRTARDGKRRYNASYLQLLHGWGFDSNSSAGAVLKGWVESRFGLLPTFHKAPLTRVGSQAWAEYIDEKMNSRYHNNCINQQLDLLYEFCQYVLSRWLFPAKRHVTLWRGVKDFSEQKLLARNNSRTLVQMNNLVSFSSDRSIADSFGYYILQTEVPLSKILFCNSLLTSHPLQGESEFIVIGGEYQVKVDYY